jgi:hypothetical protein
MFVPRGNERRRRTGEQRRTEEERRIETYPRNQHKKWETEGKIREKELLRIA